MQTLKQFASENGFSNTLVSQEEFEDGIGTCVGLNFTKDGLWYKPHQAMNEIGVELKHTGGKLQAASMQDAESQLIKQMAASGVKAAQITGNNEYAPGEFFVKVQYVK